MSAAVARFDSPVGPLTAVVDEQGDLAELSFHGVPPPAGEGGDAAGGPAMKRVRTELQDYFAGRRRDFSLPLAPRGTVFQRRVWAELCRIPYGATISYRELAARLGNPAACRAVARANATNPIAIVIPCHRVIGADGSLTGYGGGLDRKRWLLEREGALLPMVVAG
ncbi:MAG TPA: methylated-DNA--[protein]-cysteine S-methyltransferase [Thermoanaerobaculia bacterium]|jgi:methylated-DNA-[protein]-cysteine S-methyltransferase|nr:methylated-DNA--[protein]-cysteine S-methyltransferase [Thermoanaerobaculia bacterium]